MDGTGNQFNLLDVSSVEREIDIAREIEIEFRRRLHDDFDSDVAGFQAYLDRVAQFFPLPRLHVLQWTEEEFLGERGGEFVELIDTYPLESELLEDKDRIYRRSMVRYCSELLIAKAALDAGLTGEAWWHLSRARFHEGWAQGYYLAAKPVEEKRRSGKKGGIAKEASKQQAAKVACIKHLTDDRPPGGWKSADLAIRAVAPKVENTIRERREEIDVHQLLYAWLNGDPEIQQAAGFKVQFKKL